MLFQFLHVGTNQHLAQLYKVTVILVVYLYHAPRVTTSTDLSTIRVRDLGIGTDNGEWDLGQDLLVLIDSLVIVELVTRTFEYLDGVELNVGKDLSMVSQAHRCAIEKGEFTRCLKARISSSVKVSDLAMTGIRLTLVWSLRITSTSSGLSEWPVGWMKYTHA